jgi:hypothetical protein
LGHHFANRQRDQTPGIFSVQADEVEKSELFVSCGVSKTRKYQQSIHTPMKSNLQHNNIDYQSV